MNTGADACWWCVSRWLDETLPLGVTSTEELLEPPVNSNLPIFLEDSVSKAMFSDVNSSWGGYRFSVTAVVLGLLLAEEEE